MPDLPSSQFERIWVMTIGRARAEGTLDERDCLWAMRRHFWVLRLARGNALPDWDWQDRPRHKHKKKQEKQDGMQQA